MCVHNSINIYVSVCVCVCVSLQLEAQNAEQEVAITRLQSEEAGLRDALAKMAALSEGLAKDKVELNRILLRVRHAVHTHNQEKTPRTINSLARDQPKQVIRTVIVH